MTKLRTIQILRGTTVQNNAYTGVIGELTMDTTTKELRIHDGTTQGGSIIGSNRANKDLSNLTIAGANIANWSSNVTNCITEIPQDINLTLSNGTLTLKSGSKLYVPNGNGVFTELSVTVDRTSTGTGTANQTRMYFYNGSYIEKFPVSACYSGATAPSGQTYMFWYDTTNNVVKKTSNGGSTWESGWSLPFAICTSTSNVISSIDQVFNGFGYIGSTVFALPGVKYLCPDGRNTDGTLKNTSATIQNVITKTIPTNLGWHHLTLNSAGTNGDLASNFYEGTEKPSNPTTYSRYYDSVENKVYNIVSGVYSSAVQAVIPVRIEHNSSSPYAITSWGGPTAFHAVDYNDAAIKNADNVFTGKNTFADLYVGESRFANNGHLELVPSSGATNGGYLDFHYAGSSADYTSRIIENENGRLSLIAPNGTIANASDANSSVVTTVAKSKSANGYFKLGNGLIIQWGEIPAEPASATGTVTLPTAFTTTNYTVGIFYNDSVQNGKLVNPFNETTTAFSYATNSWYSANPSCGKRWIAIGY